MAEAFRRSESPVFDAFADDDNDFSLNLSEQIATVDDSMMDDVEIIENSDNEQNDTTIGPTMSMFSSFPMLSLSDDSKLLNNDMQNTQFINTVIETRPKASRRGRPSKELMQPVRSKKSIRKIKNSMTTDSVIKQEGRKFKLNGCWLRVDARDINVIEAIENSLQEISGKLNKRPNIRTLSIELHYVEMILEILQDDRLDFRGMTQEAWKEIYLMTNEKFLEVQEKLESLRDSTIVHTELPRKSKSLEKEQVVRFSGPTAKVYPAVQAKVVATNCSQDAITEVETQVIDTSIESVRNCHTERLVEEAEATFMIDNTEEIGFVASLNGSTQEISFVETNIMQIEPPLSNGLTHDPNTISGTELSSSRQSVRFSSSNASKHKSKVHSKSKGKSLKKLPSPQTTEKTLEIEEAKARVNVYSILTKFNFDLKSFMMTKLLVPGESAIIDINGKSYQAILREDGTLETENGVCFPNFGKWVHSIAGKPFSRFTVEDKRSLRLTYADVPLEDVFADVELESNAFPAVQNPVNEEKRTQESDTRLRLVPDEMIRHIKSIIVHTEAEYFPACNCYEKSWTGEEPFPQQYLEELENW